MKHIKIILSIALLALCTACGSEMDMELEGQWLQEEINALGQPNATKVEKVKAKKVKGAESLNNNYPDVGHEVPSSCACSANGTTHSASGTCCQTGHNCDNGVPTCSNYKAGCKAIESGGYTCTGTVNGQTF